MNEHTWFLEHVATQISGGLDAAERDRFARHLAECVGCAASFAEASGVDKELNELFRPVRPDPTLENRVIQSLRQEKERRPIHLAWWAKSLLGAAAAVVVGLLGYVVDAAEREGGIEQAMSRSLRTIVSSESDFRSHDLDGKFRSSPGSAGDDTATTIGATASITGPDNGRLMSVDELARKSREQTVLALSEKERTRGYLGGENRRAETKDLEEEYGKAKGDSMDFTADKPASRMAGKESGGRFAPPKMPAPGPMSQPAPPAQEPSSDPYMTYKNSAPAETKPSEYYRPGDQMARLDEAKKLAEDVAPDAKIPPKTGPKREPDKSERRDPQEQQRKIIRNGEMEFEVDSFDTSVATITQIAGEEGGYIATTNSDKLANGKTRGTIVVKCPPDKLEKLVMKLRAIGELKSQKITSEDVTKQYFDMESRLRAARTMESRLLEIIKTGKGEIKDLLQVEKELGEWRTKIEEFEGTLRYLSTMVSQSTLTITLTERNIRTAAVATERETVTMGIEAEEVDKKYQEALTAIAEAKGRVTSSELKKHQADQMQGIIRFEVAPDGSLALRTRLMQFGTVTTLDVNRVTSSDFPGKPAGEIKREDSVYALTIYNVANIQPRESTNMSLATADAEKTYKDILARVAAAKGRVVRSNLNRQPNDQTTGEVQFEVKAEDADPVLTDVQATGEVMRKTTTENPDTRNTTKSKKGFYVTIRALGAVAPRETTAISLASNDVVRHYAELQAAVLKAGGRIQSANLNEQDKHNVTASVIFEVRRTELATVEARMKAAGDVYTRTSQRAQDQENVVDSKVSFQLTLINAAAIPARETWVMGVEVREVEKVLKEIAALGQVVTSHRSREANGRIVGRVVLNVPLKSAVVLTDKIAEFGEVRVMQASKNDTVPDSDIAIARLEVTLSNAELIIPSDEGVWKQIKETLGGSFVALWRSLKWILVGVCFLGPWALIAWGIRKAYLKTKSTPKAA